MGGGWQTLLGDVWSREDYSSSWRFLKLYIVIEILGAPKSVSGPRLNPRQHNVRWN